ncbi:hypothetical protein [Alistipes sp.]|uniref:hypothetical protein n=1 Tax=Alistipes sp. TaxID=1872444 RepID=UPI002877580F|nr:hypothetical protein [Alistipes sp.]
MRKNFRDRYDNLPAIRQRKVREEVMGKLGYKYRTSFYTLLNRRLKRETEQQLKAIRTALNRQEKAK